MRLIALVDRGEPLAANGHMQETLGLAFAGRHPLV